MEFNKYKTHHLDLHGLFVIVYFVFSLLYLSFTNKKTILTALKQTDKLIICLINIIEMK